MSFYLVWCRSRFFFRKNMSLNFFCTCYMCFLKYTDLIFLSDVINHKSYTRNSIYSIGKEKYIMQRRKRTIIYSRNSVCINSMCIDEINLYKCILQCDIHYLSMTLDFIKRVNNIALCSMMANFSLMYDRSDVQS